MWTLALLTLVADATAAAAPPPPPGLTLFEFSGSSKPWGVTNDPVMGGVSNSSFSVVGGVGVWSGEVKIVPFLHAPGTCQSYVGFAAVNGADFDAVEITLASKGPLSQFQLSWGGDFVPEPPQSPPYRRNRYKAEFNVTGTGALETIVVPMTSFTSSYSSFTGGCADHGAVCCSNQHPEVCPSSKTQSSITGVGIDAQGTLGKFELDIHLVRVIKTAAGIEYA